MAYYAYDICAKVIVTLCIITRAFGEISPGTAGKTYKNCMSYPFRDAEGYVAVSDEEIDWNCMQRNFQISSKESGQPPITDSQLRRVENLFQEVMNDDPNTNIRIRKEYRIMTDEERNTFHSALNKMKDDGMYDALAAYHFGHPESHNGPAFFNWHRIFLMMFEKAVLQAEPTAIIPFWANFWDNEMEDPASSIIWDSRFAGNSFGEVTDGPAAHWSACNSPFVRNVGASGMLVSKSDVQAVVKSTKLSQISFPFADPKSNLERQHDAIHLYLGGLMSDVSRVAYDFMFFVHHGFIDCLFNEFQLNQLAKGVDLNDDWPNFTAPAHAANAKLSFFGTNLTNLDASDRRFSRARYEPSCTKLIQCTRHADCKSKYLRCDTNIKICIPVKKRSIGKECCKPTNGYSLGGGSNGGSIANRVQYSRRLNDPQYSVLAYSRIGPYVGVQNSYCIDIQRCDSKYWVYIPVQIYSYRAPDRVSYNSYPVKNGNINKKNDIYNAEGFANGNVLRDNQAERSKSRFYKSCRCQSVRGGGYIQTYGNSYEGNYRHYVQFDQVLPVSTSIGMAAVKDPNYGLSDSYIRVYDECGRMCRPQCRYNTSNDFENCDGLLTVKRGPAGSHPIYAHNIADAYTIAYNFTEDENGQHVPNVSYNNIYVRFICDYQGAWPWAQKSPQGYDTTDFVTRN